MRPNPVTHGLRTILVIGIEPNVGEVVVGVMIVADIPIGLDRLGHRQRGDRVAAPGHQQEADEKQNRTSEFNHSDMFPYGC